MADFLNEGMVKAIKLYGDVCTSVGSCDNCEISKASGGMSCAEFASKSPNMFLSALQRMSENEHTYYNEFCNRMVNCNLSVEDLADSICRKVAFEGYPDCKGGDCVACWNERYENDITITEDNNSNNQNITSLESLSSLNDGGIYQSTDNLNAVNMQNYTFMN